MSTCCFELLSLGSFVGAAPGDESTSVVGGPYVTTFRDKGPGVTLSSGGSTSYGAGAGEPVRNLRPRSVVAHRGLEGAPGHRAGHGLGLSWGRALQPGAWKGLGGLGAIPDVP